MFMSYPAWDTKQSFSDEIKVPTAMAGTNSEEQSQPEGPGDNDIEEYIKQKYESYLKEQSPNQEQDPEPTMQKRSSTRKRSTEQHSNVDELYEKYVVGRQKMGGVKERAMGIDASSNPSEPPTPSHGQENDNGQVSYDKLRSMLWR